MTASERAKRIRERFELLTDRERTLAQQGITRVAGIDEAGRGPLAGPVVAACVVFAPGTWIAGVDDSKKLSASRREELYKQITRVALASGIGVASVETIDEINILEATRRASMDALERLGIVPDYLFTDSLRLPTDVPTESIVRADATIYCVAAASIIAKVTRDKMMLELDKQYPKYGFAKNKGYGTKEHREAILRFGPSPVHRAKFLRKLLGNGPQSQQ